MVSQPESLRAKRVCFAVNCHRPSLQLLLLALAISCLLGRPLANAADISDQTRLDFVLQGVNFQSAPAINGFRYLIESDTDRDHITANAKLATTLLPTKPGIEKSFDKGDSAKRSASVFIRFELLDKAANPVPLANGKAYIDSPRQTIVVQGGAPAAGLFDADVETAQFSADLDPAAQLARDENYRIRATALACDATNTIRCTNYDPVDEAITGVRHTYLHFISTDSADAEVNAFITGSAITWGQIYAINNETADAIDQTFSANIYFDVVRYDGFDASRLFSGIYGLADVTLYEVNPSGPDIPVPVEFSALTAWNLFGYNYNNATTPSTPYAYTVSRTLRFKPAGGAQLDPVNKTYYLQADVSHREVSASPASEVEDLRSTPSPEATLYHFNGTLRFGNVNTTLLNFANFMPDGASANPAGALFGPEGQKVTTARYGTLNYSPMTHTYALAATESLGIEFESDGTAFLTSGSLTLSSFAEFEGVTIPADVGSLNGVFYNRGPITLSASGAVTTVNRIVLPQGMGWAPKPPSLSGGVPKTPRRLRNDMTLSAYRTLGSNLQPIGTYTLDPVPGGDFYVMEEGTPVLIEAQSIRWSTSQGRFQIVAPNNGQGAVQQVHEYKYSQSIISFVRSNADYWRQFDDLVGPFTNNYISAGSDQQPKAKLTATFKMNAPATGSRGFWPHMPYGSAFAYSGDGQIRLQANQIIPAESYINDVEGFFVAYVRDCYEDLCEAVDNLDANGVYQPDSRQYLEIRNPSEPTARFTPDGGLHFSGQVQTNSALYPVLNTGVETRLAWGFRDGSDHAHSTSSFAEANAFMAGHVLRGSDNTRNEPLHAPGILLNTGVTPGNLSQTERPDMPNLPSQGYNAYQVGLGDYPGLNFRVGADANTGSSILGDSSTPVSYPLGSRSKYYVRYGGVTGIHETLDFPTGALLLYGYPVSFDQFGLAFMDNRNVTSRTDGAIDVPYPSDFTQQFEEMRFTCKGGLDTAEIPEDSPDLELTYWLSTITPYTLSFASPDTCGGTSEAYLTMFVDTNIAYVPQTLFGILGWESNGDLVNENTSTGIDVDSRLALPNRITLDGSGGESYTLTVVSTAYLNDYTSHPESAGSPGDIGLGRAHFAGLLDVAFFRDMRVHVETSPNDSLENAPLDLAGGWPEGGQTFWENTGFDPENRGHPTGALYAYFNRANSSGNIPGDPEQYRPRAKQDLFGVVPLDYPMDFNSNLRNFTGYKDINNDLLILNIDHSVPYLSNENAELQFGVTYDGLPQINLTNFAINQLDETTGLLSGMVNTVGDTVVDRMDDGIDSVDKLLNDRFDELLDEVLDAILDNVEPPVLNSASSLPATAAATGPAFLDRFYNDLEVLYQSHTNAITPPTNDWATDVDNLVDSYISSGAPSSLEGLLGNLDSLPDADVLSRVDDALARFESAVVAIVGDPDLPNPNQVQLPTDLGSELVEPLLAFDSVRGEYVLLSNLLQYMIADLSGEAGAAVEILVDSLGQSLDDFAAEALSEAQPTIDDVRTVLFELLGQVRDIREQLEPAAELAAEIEAIVEQAAQAGGEIETMVNQLRTEITNELLAQIPDYPEFPEYNREAIKNRIRTLIKDRVRELGFVSDIQLALRQRLYDLNSRIRTAVDDVFAQVNRELRDALASSLSGLDESINGMLGDVNDVLGSGQLDGYAYINGDALRELRIDARLELKVPDDFTFNGYLHIIQYDSTGMGGCSIPGSIGLDAVTEVKMGARDVSVDWISPDLRMDVEGKFSLNSGAPIPYPVGMGGEISMTGGELSFEAFAITDFGVAASFGAIENYLAASLGMRFTNYAVYGGAYFGRTCSIDPLLLVNEEVQTVLGDPPFTGVYVYGKGHIPISEALGIPATCFFRISAGIGAGAFVFVEGPTIGGQIDASVTGEALCVVTVGGEVSMIGAKVGDDLNYSGRGSISGKVGWCPFCLKFSKSVGISQRSGSWDVSL